MDKNGLRLKVSKVKSIKKLGLPSEKKDIKVFLGIFKYYFLFIKNLSKHEEFFSILKKI